MRFLSVPEPYRPAVTTALIVACCLAAALNLAILRAYHRTPGSLARGLYKYGPIGVFRDPPIEPVSIQVKDGRRLR